MEIFEYMVWQQTLIPLIIYVCTIIFALVSHSIAYRIIKKVARRTEMDTDNILVGNLYGPSRLFVVLCLLAMAVPFIPESFPHAEIVNQAMQIAWIVALAWTLVKFVIIFERILLKKYDITVTDNLRARTVQTQYRVIKRIFILAIVILGAGAALMTFDAFRQLGASILASAGIAGIVIGFSAQKTLGTIFAGIQIAFTQPIRIDDVVIVEDEWGRIEEITLTYVVVRIWDNRRLILPITYFLDTPFQNWTRSGTDLLGSVLLFVDYTIPVDDVRAELNRICQEEKGNRWDGQVCSLQVTDNGEKTMTLRALISAPDSAQTWELRCLVREKLLAYLQKNHPGSLPRVRLEGPATGSETENIPDGVQEPPSGEE